MKAISKEGSSLLSIVFQLRIVTVFVNSIKLDSRIGVKFGGIITDKNN